MNRSRRNTRSALLLSSALLAAGLLSPAWAASSTAAAFEQCRAAAEVAYGSADEPADVRLDGVRKSGKQLRLQVFTPEGDQFVALCNVNRKTGELVSMDPPARPEVKEDLASTR